MSFEKVLCLKKNSLPKQWQRDKVALNLSYGCFLQQISKNGFLFVYRKDAENDKLFKQLIPYVIVTNIKGQLLVYKRQGNEKRVHGLWSIGVGGHIDEADSENCRGIKCILEKSIERELKEELLIDNVVFSNLNFLGIMNEEITKVGLVHIAAVFTYTVSDLKNINNSTELKTYKWVDRQEILKNFKLELWSEMAFSMLLDNKL